MNIQNLCYCYDILRINSIEVQEMELIEERGVDPNREGNNPHNGNTSNNSITVARLLNGGKKQIVTKCCFTMEFIKDR